MFDIADMLSRHAATDKQINRTYLFKILLSVRFLARQGLPIRSAMVMKMTQFYSAVASLWGGLLHNL